MASRPSNTAAIVRPLTSPYINPPQRYYLEVTFENLVHPSESATRSKIQDDAGFPFKIIEGRYQLYLKIRSLPAGSEYKEHFVTLAYQDGMLPRFDTKKESRIGVTLRETKPVAHAPQQPYLNTDYTDEIKFEEIELTTAHHGIHIGASVYVVFVPRDDDGNEIGSAATENRLVKLDMRVRTVVHPKSAWLQVVLN